MNKKLIQVLLPLSDNKGKDFPEDLYIGVKSELVNKFGGLTAYTRSPATGLWKEGRKKITRDEIVVYEVLADKIENKYWQGYKKKLEELFSQDSIMIICTEARIL